MKEFYIFTIVTFLEIILATLAVLELQNQTKKLKACTVEVEEKSKLFLDDFKDLRFKLKEFNKTFDEKLTINQKNLAVISKLVKEIVTDTITGKVIFKKSNILFTTLEKVWKHKTEFFWLIMAVILTNKKTA